MGLLGDFGEQFVSNPGGNPLGSFMQFLMNNRGKYKGKGGEQPEGQPMGGNMMQMGGMMGRRPKMMGGGLYNMPQMQPMQGQGSPYSGLQQPGQGMMGMGQGRPASPYAGLGNMGMWRR